MAITSVDNSYKPRFIRVPIEEYFTTSALDMEHRREYFSRGTLK